MVWNGTGQAGPDASSVIERLHWNALPQSPSAGGSARPDAPSNHGWGVVTIFLVNPIKKNAKAS